MKKNPNPSKTCVYTDEEIVILFPAKGFVVRLVFADGSFLQDTVAYTDYETAEAWAIVEQAIVEATHIERACEVFEIVEFQILEISQECVH